MTETVNDAPKIDPREEQLNQYIWAVISNTFAGIRATAPLAPPEILMAKIAAAVGSYMGQMTSRGDIATLMRMRGDCIKMFGENVRVVRIEAPDMPAGSTLKQ